MSAVKNGTLYYQVYQNTNEGSDNYQKWYARAKHTETVTFSQLITHMTEHNIGYPRGVVTGVMMSFVDCLLEIVAQSKKVQLGDLGTFYLAINTKPADKYEEFSATTNIKGCSLRFLASQTNENNLSRSAFTAAMRYKNFTSVMSEGDRLMIDLRNMDKNKKDLNPTE